MKLKALFTDDDAVSPVIGVILMVAITVILAAVIGTFVLGLGDKVGNNAPQASFSFDFSDGSNEYNDELEIVHNGGATISATSLSIKSSGDFDMTDGDGDSNAYSSRTWKQITSGTDVSAGDSATIYADAGNSNGFNDDTVRIIWTSDSGDSSAELGTWNGPDA